MSQVAETEGKYAGLSVDVFGRGKVQLTRVLSQAAETSVYYTSHPSIVVKVFDLSCDKPGEVSYGPYMRFTLELANFEDIMKIESLQPVVPAYYGANINYESQHAWIAMEYLQGDNLQTWSDEASNAGFPEHWLAEFREALFQVFSLVERFHKHGIILIDFKPENVMRLHDRRIKFVDLGSFFTPRQQQATDRYLYSATPDYAELLIDASHIQTGLPITAAADIFSAGVGLFQMATGSSRLVIQDMTAEQIVHTPEIYRFRDSQIRDLWHEFPHLKKELPLIETQLRERQLLFSEFWHLLKGYLSRQIPDWDELPQDHKDQVLLNTGTTFIMEQLPAPLQWLAGAIAQASVLRSLRFQSITELRQLIALPVADEVKEDLHGYSELLALLREGGFQANFIDSLNTWDVRANPESNHWAVAASLIPQLFGDNASFTYLKRKATDPWGNRFYSVTGDDLEAEDFQDRKLTVWEAREDPSAWIC